MGGRCPSSRWGWNLVTCHGVPEPSLPENVSALKTRLRSIHPAFADFEVEELILYPAVAERIRKLGLPYRAAHRPDRLPPQQV